MNVDSDSVPNDQAAADSNRCGTCGGATTPIAYGYPSVEMFEAAERGEVVLGGCLTFAGQPTAQCRECSADSEPRPSREQ